MKLLELKELLHKECVNINSKQILALKNAIKQAQDAANNETKSSAGDKHETGRAMAQLETEKLTTQLSISLKTEEVLNQIDTKLAHTRGSLGSLIITGNGNFYLSVSLGKIIIDDKVFFAISSASPIGKILLTKKEKESFSFNGKSYLIETII